MLCLWTCLQFAAVDAVDTSAGKTTILVSGDSQYPLRSESALSDPAATSRYPHPVPPSPMPHDASPVIFSSHLLAELSQPAGASDRLTPHRQAGRGTATHQRLRVVRRERSVSAVPAQVSYIVVGRFWLFLLLSCKIV